LGLHPAVRAQAQPYMAILGLGAPPLLLYATFRRYLQGVHAVRPVMAALVSANLVNAFGNWVLIWGHFGVPALGINGSAWATVGARVYMAAFLGVAIRREHRKRGDAHTRIPFVFEARACGGFWRSVCRLPHR
jgi:MATE family multidrug resistance protein